MKSFKHFSPIATNWLQGSALEPVELQAPPAVPPGVRSRLSLQSEAEPQEQCIPWQSQGTKNGPKYLGVQREVSSLRRFLAIAGLIIGMACVTGCGQDGPVRYSLSGTVSMPDGKPVPAGEVSLEPDSKVGNSGPGTMVQIKAGKFNIPKDQGIVGGKYTVTISPFDGVAFGESLQGRPLTKAQHVEKIDFPAKNSTYDFKVTTK